MRKFWKRKHKPCEMCQRYAIRMDHIRQAIDRMDSIIRGKGTLTDSDVTAMLTPMHTIRIEANKKER